MNEEIIGFDALYDSMTKCQKGVRWKDSVAHYHLNAIEETIKLEEELRKGIYKQRKAKRFTVYRPKRRDIISATFRDRVYQRSLCDNGIYPQMVKSFIRDNCACQKGKGTDDCRKRLEVLLRRYFINYGADGYVLQLHIQGYYPNMPHRVAEAAFARRLDPETYDERVSVLRGQYSGDKGYNPGSQIVQMAGISVLDRLDHYAKEKLRCKYYVRYMDDAILISHDRRYLERCLQEISNLLSEMGFSANPKKTNIYRLLKGIPFLGFSFRLTETGKVLRLISSQNVKSQRKRLARMVALCKRGKLARHHVDQSYQSWRAHASKGNTYRLLARMDKYYKTLWEA